MLFYQALSILLSPITYLYLVIRLLKGKEDFNHFKERFGFPSKKRPNGELIWIHSVSVGESNSALTLIEEITKNNPSLNILLTSTTTTSANLIKNKDNQQIIHQFLPVDDYFSSKRFIKYWQPKMAIFIESEIWPNLINICKENSIKLALINGRISDKSFSRWKLLNKIGFNILRNFDIALAQSKNDAIKFQDLGMEKVEFVGNLKSCSKPLEFDKNKLELLRKQIKNRPFWLAASTHSGEEEVIIQIHQELKEKFPQILTIIAPRHPKRMDEIVRSCSQAASNSLSFCRRSRNEKIEDITDIYFADTLGEMGLFYKLSDISLVCGSLKDNIGGHNPFEAIKLGSITLSGQYVANFKQIYQELEIQKLVTLVQNKDDLKEKLEKLLSDKKLIDSFKENLEKYRFNSNQVLNQIGNMINKTLQK